MIQTRQAPADAESAQAEGSTPEMTILWWIFNWEPERDDAGIVHQEQQQHVAGRNIKMWGADRRRAKM